MTLPTMAAREYKVDVVTHLYLLSGDLAPLGPLLTYLNSADRAVVTIRGVTAAALEEGNTVESFRAEELIVAKDDIIAVRVLQPVTQATVQLLPRRERLLVFTPCLVVQGDFHCGPDTRVGDLFEATPGRWAPASDARVYPLFRLRLPLFHEAHLLLVNKRHIRMYHAVGN